VDTSPTEWEFRWTDSATDRTGTVVFSIGFDNMASPVMRENRLHERTVAIVGGQGENELREVVIRTGPNYHADDNHRETFVDAPDVESTAGLNARGDQRLHELQATSGLTFNVRQTPVTKYGEHYFLGDLVTVRSPITDEIQEHQIWSVRVTVEQGGRQVETIDIRTVDAVSRAPAMVDDDPLMQVGRSFGALARRVARLESQE
jgi:hypothetical protein